MIEESRSTMVPLCSRLIASTKRRKVHGLSQCRVLRSISGVHDHKIRLEICPGSKEKTQCATVVMLIPIHEQTANVFHRPPSVVDNACHALPLSPSSHLLSPHAQGPEGEWKTKTSVSSAQDIRAYLKTRRFSPFFKLPSD